MLRSASSHFACLLGLALFATGVSTGAAHAQVNHGDYLGTSVDFLAVTETTQTAGDPAVLWDAPSLAGSGDQLLFFPPAFLSSCAQGSSDVTTSELATTLVAHPAGIIESISIFEDGDVTLTKFPPFGDPTTNADATLIGVATVTETTAGPIAPVAIPFSGSFTPAGGFALPGDFGTQIWNGNAFVDVASVVPNATRVEVTIENSLSTNCGAGNSSAKIQKKVVGGPVVAILVNPTQCDVEIDKTCCVVPPPSPGIDQCDGKVVRMKFEYLNQDCSGTTNTQEGKAQCSGGAPGDPVGIVITKDDDKISASPSSGIGAGTTFELTTTEDDFASETKFRIEGPDDDQSLAVHTSCSKALSCGDQFGSVRLVELETTEGGIINCEATPGEGTACLAPGDPAGTLCDERPVQVVFEYTGADCQDPLPQDPDKAECAGDPAGSDDVNIIYTGKDPNKITVSPASMIDVGDQFTLTATGRDELHSASKFIITNGAGTLQTLELHTSCSQPLRLGDEFGALKVVGFTEKNGTVRQLADPNAQVFLDACEVPLATPGPHCTSKVMELQLVFIGDFLGEGCTVSNAQEGNGTCTGAADPGDPASVTITRDDDKVFADPATGIEFGDVISIYKEEGGVRKELSSSTEFSVSGGLGTQDIELHTSCSKPLNLGDRFGSFVVFGIDREDEGFVGLGGEIEYQYTVTAGAGNSGPIANMSVDDDQLGNIASGETLQPGESRTFFATKTLYGSKTNTAFVNGDIGGGLCQPDMDSVEVSVTAPPPGAFDCSDAKPIDQLTMTWNGTQNVHVKAWDGEVGGTLLVDTFALDPGDPVQPGEDFAVSGMDGSPNDQVWEIFAASNLAKLGESKFHISCSDDSMNGVEDCGKPMGDGKSNDAGFLNDWLLEGMAGDVALECTPGDNVLPPVCGFGPELLVLLPGLFLAHRRRQRRSH